ncbi:MAG: hypothetical protein U5N55_02760 [Cypionkella sp.]|nr:hypothetical protein [Cypionkella sp.]
MLRSVFLVLSFMIAAAAPASAHSGRMPAGPDSGIAIPNITHGQMQVLYGFSAEVLDLAARQPGADETFRRILTHAHIQKTYCAMGLMPGAVSDEASPFNACSHAYLAATQDLLLRMAAMPSRSAAVDNLARRIDGAMMENGTALQLCQYSSDTFNTANILKPDWLAALVHVPSLAGLAGLAFAMAAMVWMAGRALRTPLNPT